MSSLSTLPMVSHNLNITSSSHTPMLSFPDISPIAFSLFGIDVFWYGIAYVVGILCAWIIASKKLQGTNIKKEQLDNAITIGIIGIIVGGRLGFVLLYNPEMLFNDPMQVFNTRGGGMSFHGGLLGVVLLVGYYLYKNKISILRFADIISIGAPAGMFFGRIANFINQEHIGKISSFDNPFAIIFPITRDNIPRHPSQLYEAFLEGLIPLFIMLILDYLKPSLRKKHPGFMFGLFLSLSGISRIIAEIFRTPDGVFMGISLGQLYSLPLVIVGIGLMIFSFACTKKKDR